MKDALPLAGRCVVVTRPGEQGEALVERLETLGARVARVDVLTVAPPLDPEPFERAIANLSSFAWIAFASANGVRSVAAHQAARAYLCLQGDMPRIAAVGAATARAAEAEGWHVAASPTASNGAALGAAAPVAAGDRVLLPRAESGLPHLRDVLRRRGAEVTDVVAYRTVARSDVGAAFTALATERPDIVTFTSPSTVNQFVLAGAHAGYDTVRAQGSAGLRIVCIGQTTAAAARAHGLLVNAVAGEPSEAGLIDAVLRCLGGDDRQLTVTSGVGP
jgi:uroporphyrinogen III methyltransferase/synthase